jgi:hypothetical protein
MVDREELFEELMGPLYKHLARHGDDPLDSIPLSPHQVAIIFMVCLLKKKKKMLICGIGFCSWFFNGSHVAATKPRG